MTEPTSQPPVHAAQAEIDRAMMLRAIEQAQHAAAMGEVPVGAVIYRGEEILAQQFNLRESQRDPTAHAEILALRAAARLHESWRMEGCSMAVTLEPCPMCAGALINARMDRLVYGATDPRMGAVHTLYELCTDVRFNHRMTVIAGVEAQRCAQLLQDFFRARRGNVKPAKPKPREE